MKASKILGTLGVCGAGVIGVSQFLKLKQDLEDVKKVEMKIKRYNLVLNEWLTLKQNNESILSYFEKNNYKKIAIYGMGTLGVHLYDELKNTNVQIVYAIDQEAKRLGYDIPMYTPSDFESTEEDVDVIVITAIADYIEILENNVRMSEMNVISLEEVIFNRV